MAEMAQKQRGWAQQLAASKTLGMPNTADPAHELGPSGRRFWRIGVPPQRRTATKRSLAAPSINSASHGLTLWQPYTKPRSAVGSRSSGACLNPGSRQIRFIMNMLFM